MVDNREALYSANVVMEAEAIMYLNYTQDKKKSSHFFLVMLGSDFLEYTVCYVVNSTVQRWLGCTVSVLWHTLQVFVWLFLFFSRSTCDRFDSFVEGMQENM